MRTFEQIPSDELEDAILSAAVPSKKVGAHTRGIFEAVAKLRAAKERGGDCISAWETLSRQLDAAVAADETSAFDDMVAAWTLDGLRITGMIIDGKLVLDGHWDREPIRRRTIETLEAIRDLQYELNRVPSREELRDQLKCQMSDLNAVLKRLGWLARFPIRFC